jgi:hypothetical protein
MYSTGFTLGKQIMSEEHAIAINQDENEGINLLCHCQQKVGKAGNLEITHQHVDKSANVRFVVVDLSTWRLQHKLCFSCRHVLVVSLLKVGVVGEHLLITWRSDNA